MFAVGDLPARASMLNMQEHKSYNPCSICHTEGFRTKRYIYFNTYISTKFSVLV